MNPFDFLRSGLPEDPGDDNERDRWPTAEADPKLIRAYDHPVDGRYLLGADVAAWLRDLARVAHDGTPVAAAIHAPFLDRMAETVDGMLT